MYSAVLEGDDIVVETHATDEQIYRIVQATLKALHNSGKSEFSMYESESLRCVVTKSYDYVFVIVCSQSVQLRICCAYLKHVQHHYCDEFVLKQKTLKKKKYSQWLTETLEFYMDGETSPDKLNMVKKDVNETKEIMCNNIVKLNARGEKLDALHNITTSLNNNAEEFSKDSEKLKCQKCLKYYFCCFASCCRCCCA